jgi:hypothetical protein
MPIHKRNSVCHLLKVENAFLVVKHGGVFEVLFSFDMR